MSSILLTGIAVLDIINEVESYPDEDSEIRATSQYLRRGGNASNTATVLSQLKHDCVLAATLSNDHSGMFLNKDLNKNSIHLASNYILDEYTTPTSYITLNKQNGSRTIIHYRSLPELSFEQFDVINLEIFDWFHFEGRNCHQTVQMMQKTKRFSGVISLEIEKDRKNIESLIPFADIIFLSRPFAIFHGFHNPEDCLSHFNSLFPEKLFVCTWGSDGACAKQQTSTFSSPAIEATRIIDTLGAGDTFIAAFIHAQLNKYTTQDSLVYACKLAGLKCSQPGLENLEL